MMECEYYRELISCLVDGELSEAEEKELADHLNVCPECAALHAAFADLSSLMEEDMEDAPESLCANVMAELRRAEIIKKNRRKSAVKAVLATAACAVFVIAAGRLGGFKAADTAVSYTNTAVFDVAAMPEAETFAVPAEAPAEEMKTGGTMFMAAAPMAPAASAEETAEEAVEDGAAMDFSTFSVRQANTADEGMGEDKVHDWQSLNELLNGEAVENVELPDYPIMSLTAFDEGVYYSLSFFEAENGLYYFDPMDGALKFTEISPDVLAKF